MLLSVLLRESPSRTCKPHKAATHLTGRWRNASGDLGKRQVPSKVSRKKCSQWFYDVICNLLSGIKSWIMQMKSPPTFPLRAFSCKLSKYKRPKNMLTWKNVAVCRYCPLSSPLVLLWFPWFLWFHRFQSGFGLFFPSHRLPKVP